MSRQLPVATVPVTLLFGVFDPTGFHDIPADNVTCAAHGVHALAVPTGFALADSTGVFQVDAPNTESLDEQARCLLEDMPIQSIKIGAVPSAEIASAVAEIVADYGSAPVVLHLPPAPVASQEEPEDDFDPAVGAVLELLLPQTTVAVMPAGALSRWLNEDVRRHLDGADGPEAMLTLGADWILVTGYLQRPGALVNLLLGPDGQTMAWPSAPSPDRLQETSGLVATALAARLARGQAIPEAAQQACQYAAQAAQQPFQAGMGRRLATRLPMVER